MGPISGLPGPTDAWTTLAGLARDTAAIRLGTLVTSATFRHPGPLAITVAGVDQMSGGRVELGIGAGWYEAEHAACAIPFPPLGERFDRLEEQLAIITGMWATPTGETFDFAGRHYQVAASPGLPKPAQRDLPIIIGGGGPKRTPALAARYAAEFNMAFKPLPLYVDRRAKVEAACRGDRARPGIAGVWSAALVVCVGRNEAELARRAKAIGREVGELRENGGGRHPRRGGRHAPPLGGRDRHRPAPTSRCSTCTTSSTSSSSPRRSSPQLT